MTATFTCAVCRQTFTKQRSDAEAEAEYAAQWGHDMGEKRAVICDDCYTKFMAWYRRHGKQEAQA